MLMETIRSTQFHAGGDNTKHKILHSQRLHEAHNSTLADHVTIPCSWRQYKAHNSTLVETIQSITFHACKDYIKHTIPCLRLMETIQSTTFHARGDYIKHTIPCLRITLQFHAHGDNTKHNILRLRRAHKADCRKLHYHTYNGTIHITLQNIYNITIHITLQYITLQYI